MRAVVEDEGEGETFAIATSVVTVLPIAPIITDTTDKAFGEFVLLIVERGAIVVRLFSP
jgi:hypothetical protein